MRSGRHHDSVAVANPVLFGLLEDELCLALFDSEELVGVWMHFVANLFVG
jgi:hypothetical protein